jgi:hypothetical protein
MDKIGIELSSSWTPCALCVKFKSQSYVGGTSVTCHDLDTLQLCQLQPHWVQEALAAYQNLACAGHYLLLH